MKAATLLVGLAGAVVSLGACEGKTEPTPESTPPAPKAQPPTSAKPGVQPAALTAQGKEAMSDKAENEEPAPSGKIAFNPALEQYVSALLPDVERVPEDRKKELERIAEFVSERIEAKQPAQLTFICTHNSRRSHLGQLWATVAAAHYGVAGVESFSGGTESTAFNPRAVAALERAGFRIENPGGDNPHYKVHFSDAAPAQESFSKKYDDPFNPKNGFVAIMTCSQADKSCPYVKGAALRVAVPYVDPKESDGTREEAATYDARAKQIATEMFYVFSHLKA